MNRGTLPFVVVLTAVLLAFSATVASSASSTLNFSFTGLERLDAGHYEGWAIFGEEKVSTGKFNLAADDSLTSLDGAAIESFSVDRDLNSADTIVLTIEPDGDIDAIPSGIVVLAAPVVGTEAALAFPVDLSSIAGSYVLATPTDDDDTNEVAGVWFLEPSGPAAALTLPEPPGGWVYEGWGVTQGTPLTTGRFTTADGADMEAPFSGPNPGPPFPGEDFVSNLPAAISGAVNLADGASVIVISVEPYLDGSDPTGAAPFSIKPLVGSVPAGLAELTLTAMGQNLDTVPSGLASIGAATAATAAAAAPAPSTAGGAGLASGAGSTPLAATALLALVVAALALGARRLTRPR